MSEIVFIHGVGEAPGPGRSVALDSWIETVAAPVPARAEQWLRDHSAMVYYQDWEWYPDRTAREAGSEGAWDTIRSAINDMLDQARYSIDTVDPAGLRDLARAASHWSESERVLAASKQVADQMSAFNLWQVPAFLENVEGSRDRIIGRVAEIVDADTRVIVAHSLGSVVAYEAAHELDLDVEMLVTLGSPLGIPGYVYDRLRPAASYPGGVRRWTNVNHPTEPVARVPDISPLFRSSDAARRVEDLTLATDSTYPWHAIDAYLARDEVRRVIWDAIGLGNPMPADAIEAALDGRRD